MTDDRANIKLPREDYQRHNQRRQDMGLSWAEYLDGEAPSWPGVDEEQLADVLAERLPERLARELEGRLQ